MASASSVLEDIDDKFCQCCLCYSQYKDPRQLPCLHHFCTECIQKVINNYKDTFNCPLCQETVDIPENGAKGLKKDVYMNEIIEYIQFKKSLKYTKLHTCGDCSKQEKAMSYCFKCSDFLCKHCHEYHLTHKSLLEHRPHLLSLSDIEAKNITLEKLSSLKEVPRCETHLDNVFQLCCKTCKNLPICLACTYGLHKAHEFEDVILFAESEKQRLKESLSDLNDCKEGVYKMAERIEQIMEEIEQNANMKTVELNQMYQSQTANLKTKENGILEEEKCKLDEINVRQSQKELNLKREMEVKLQQIRDEYKVKIGNVKEETKVLVNACTVHHNKEKRTVKGQNDKLKEKFDNVSRLIKEERGAMVRETEKTSQNLQNTIRRFENITAMSLNILESKNHWTAVLNVDGICQAVEPLVKDMKREYPDVDNMSRFIKSDTRMRIFGRAQNVKIYDDVEVVQNIKGIPGDGQFIEDITCTGSKKIVISGGSTSGKAHITIIDIKGETIKQQIIQFPQGGSLFCYCAAYKTHKVVIAGKDDVGVYDTRDGSFYRKSLSHVVGNTNALKLKCVTTDDINNNIIVGCEDQNNLYILDEQLNLVRTLKLLEGMRFPRGITFIDEHIIVIGDKSRACMVDMGGKVVHEFTTPFAAGCDQPFSVCTDSNGFIYILWMEGIYSDYSCAVAQYSPDDYSLLDERSVNANASSMTTAVVDNNEKLLLSHWSGGRMHVYGLYED